MGWSISVKDFSNSKMTIGGKVFQTKMGELSHSDLNFYVDNPRVYTAINAGGGDLDQDQIEKYMCEQPHVRGLRTQILDNKGLLEAIVVRDKIFDVLEGNSRLAAYRLMKGNREYQTLMCTVLPSDIDEDSIFAFLGQIHINGKTPWAKHEQARYLQREAEKGKEIDHISRKIGISPTEGKKQVKTIELMQKYMDRENDHFSYYYVYLGNQAAQSAFRDYPKLESIIANEIKTGSFKKATDFRDALSPVCNDRTALKKLLSGKRDLPEALDFIEEKGVTKEISKRVRRAQVSLKDIDREALEDLKNIAQINRVEMDLKGISRKSKTLLEIISDIKKAKPQNQ